MAEYTPEEIVEMADQLMKDIADSTKDIAASESSSSVTDITMTANFADRCASILKSLAENVAELQERVDILTEKQ